ncbi:hypothetical protein LWI29_027641 [Acer saccharum]|uniref:DUF8039 domain-containing protein n=1 Tax=Acer saccharum TaxID=4024 RepID=A0AA39RYZ3_ACESA|nr:hypothetical protein LWI29_027641 [Acer saccharum]
MLAMGASNNVVAHGTIMASDDPFDTIHGIPISYENVRVSIDVAIKPLAPLPFSVRDELLTVGEAVGSYVVWPKNLIILSQNEDLNKKHQSKGKKIEEVIGKMEVFYLEKFHSSKKWLEKYTAKLMVSNDTIDIHKESNIIGEDGIVNLMKSDIHEFCAMEEISTNCIVIYIRYLYGILKQNKLLDKFAFVDPNHIAYFVGSKEERARLLNKRL